MNTKRINSTWLEKFPTFIIDGIDNKRFLNGLTTSNLNQTSSNILKTCLLDPKGVLKALIEIHYINSHLLILILEGDANAIRNRFEDMIFPNDKVEISSIQNILRIQKVDNNFSWREHNPILLNEDDYEEYISKNSLSVMNSNDLKIWKIRQAIPLYNFEIDYKNNPLELGLADLIDFQKGCFLGQEMMARLRKVSSLKQEIRLWKSNEIIKNNELTNEKVYLENDRQKIVGHITRFAEINKQEFIGLVLIKKNYLEGYSLFSNKFGKIELHQSIGSIFS